MTEAGASSGVGEFRVGPMQAVANSGGGRRVSVSYRRQERPITAPKESKMKANFKKMQSIWLFSTDRDRALIARGSGPTTIELCPRLKNDTLRQLDMSKTTGRRSLCEDRVKLPSTELTNVVGPLWNRKQSQSLKCC